MALYLRLLAGGIRSRMQYRFDFVISTILYGFITAIDFMTVAAILSRYRTVDGWNIYQIAVLSGLVSASNGLYRIFCAELNSFERYLVTGEFDILLIRPWPTLASLLTRSFDFGRLGAFLQGAFLVGLGLWGTSAPLWLWVYCLVVPVAGFLVIASIYLAVAAAGFWITRIDDLQTFAGNAPMSAANFPMEIYPAALRWLFFSLLPVGAIGYLPMTYAFGKGGSPLGLAAPFVAAPLAVMVSVRLWRWGERHYQSSGS